MTHLFQGPAPPSGHFSPELLSPAFRNIIDNNGFSINPEKVHYADRHSRKMVTGLKVNEIINVDRRFVRNIRAALYSVETLGRESAQEKFEKKHGGKSTIDKYIRGKIAWLGFVRGQSDPVFRGIALRFNTIFPEKRINTTPTRNEIRDRAVWIVEYCYDKEGEVEVFQGSAFFLKGVGLVTAAHCVSTAEDIDVYHPSKYSNKFKVSVAKIDALRDLAILDNEIPATEYFELESSHKSAVLCEELTAVGYPNFGPGDGLNVRPGRMSSFATKSGVKLIEVTRIIQQGMSGGPVLNNLYEVVGVIHKGGNNEERDFAVDIHEIHNWLSEKS